jgi:hypothetical protein
LTGSDSLTARNYREFRRRCHTLTSLSKVRALAWDKRPKEKLTTDLGGGLELSSKAHKAVPLRTVFDYYWASRILMGNWALCGNFKVTSSKLVAGGTSGDVLYCPLGTALHYADYLLRKSSDRPLETALEWMSNRDELTRGKIVMLAREGMPMGEAIEAALADTKVEWAMGNAQVHPGGGGSQSRNRSRSRSRRKDSPRRKATPKKEVTHHGEAGRVRTGTTLPGGKPICKAHNDGRGCTKAEKDCPKKQAHACDAMVGKKVCGKRDCVRSKHH